MLLGERHKKYFVCAGPGDVNGTASAPPKVVGYFENPKFYREIVNNFTFS